MRQQWGLNLKLIPGIHIVSDKLKTTCYDITNLGSNRR